MTVSLCQGRKPSSIKIYSIPVYKIGILARIHSAGPEINLSLVLVHLVHSPNHPLPLCDLVFY